MDGLLVGRQYNGRMDEKKPKRRWFQFHLATAVVMMVAAGGILWACLQPIVTGTFSTSFTTIEDVEYGWPIPIYYGARSNNSTFVYHAEHSDHIGPIAYKFESLNLVALLVNILFLLGSLP